MYFINGNIKFGIMTNMRWLNMIILVSRVTLLIYIHIISQVSQYESSGRKLVEKMEEFKAEMQKRTTYVTQGQGLN